MRPPSTRRERLRRWGDRCPGSHDDRRNEAAHDDHKDKPMPTQTTSDRKLVAYARLSGYEPLNVVERDGLVLWQFDERVNLDLLARQFAAESRLKEFSDHLLRSFREVGTARKRALVR